MGISASFSECGPVRRVNADALLADDGRRFYAIADGIGSRPASADASRVAVSEAHRAYLELRADLPVCGVTAVIDRAAESYRKHFAGDRAIPGTTLTVLIIEKNALHFASVGDSPVLLLYDGGISLLTRHHTAVDQAQVIQDFTALKSQSGSNILVNTVGRFAPRPISYPAIPIPGRCQVLLCTDGLFEIVSQAEIGFLGQHTRSSTGLAAVLRARANRTCASDNYSAIIIDLEQEEDGNAQHLQEG